MKNQEEKIAAQRILLEKLMEIWKQAMIWAGVGAVSGVIYALIRKIPLINGAINGIYILGMLLSIYAVFGAPVLFQRRGIHKETYSTEVVQNAMRERKKRQASQWMDYLRAMLVFLVGVLLETVKFYLI